ncbi:uncharacterized protein C4orf51 homolog [Dipodomys merriami]|uniref:uncharacterized protein C4orf51 homolog n=1 Tax=Dipodomys merriami TaxID=94247 RepID=UPI003855CDAC
MSHFFYLSPEILVPFRPLSSQEFELIKSKARATWQDESRWSNSCVTTYSGSYRGKQLDESSRSQLSPRARRYKPEKKWMPLLNISEHPASQPWSQDAINELPPGVSGALKNPVDMKHSVVHQIWGYGSNHTNSSGRPPKLEIYTEYKCGMKSFLKHIQQRWDSESKFGFSEDSEVDSDYSRGGR